MTEPEKYLKVVEMERKKEDLAIELSTKINFYI
jgi:hypothetical protein